MLNNILPRLSAVEVHNRQAVIGDVTHVGRWIVYECYRVDTTREFALGEIHALLIDVNHPGKHAGEVTLQELLNGCAVVPGGAPG